MATRQKDRSIPFRIRIGVVGRRDLSDPDQLEPKFRMAIEKIPELFFPHQPAHHGDSLERILGLPQTTLRSAQRRKAVNSIRRQFSRLLSRESSNDQTETKVSLSVLTPPCRRSRPFSCQRSPEDTRVDHRGYPPNGRKRVPGGL